MLDFGKKGESVLLEIAFVEVFSMLTYLEGFSSGSEGKESSCNEGDLVWSLGWEDPLEEGMATHSSILARKSPWTEVPAGLQSMRSQRVGHDWVTKYKYKCI